MITSNHTKANFGWKLMPHPPYSVDLSPSDYHLLGSLTNHIKGTYEENLHEFFDYKSQEFYANGMHDLLRRRREVIATNEIPFN